MTILLSPRHVAAVPDDEMPAKSIEKIDDDCANAVDIGICVVLLAGIYVKFVNKNYNYMI